MSLLSPFIDMLNNAQPVLNTILDGVIVVGWVVATFVSAVAVITG